MKSIIPNTHGRSCLVDNDRSSSDVDGSGQPGVQDWKQEAGDGSSGSSSELCQRSQRDRVWKEIKYLLGSLDRIKDQLTGDWEQGEIDWINERYRICRKQALDYVLCLNISVVLETASFPGEHLTYLEVARRLVLDCTEWELADAILQIGLNPHERVYYKVRTDLMSVEQAEVILREMIGAGEYLLASDFTKRLAIPVKSATYTALKKDLVARGWKWQTKRVEGKPVKAISR